MIEGLELFDPEGFGRGVFRQRALRECQVIRGLLLARGVLVNPPRPGSAPLKTPARRETLRAILGDTDGARPPSARPPLG